MDDSIAPPDTSQGDYIVPATVLISGAKEEVRPGDRLLPVPERSFANYVPHAPHQEVDARVISIYGSVAMKNAGNNQVVVINKGTDDGMEQGHVLRLLTKPELVKDKTPEGGNTVIQLPSEYSGLAMVFLAFERVSYALIVKAEEPVNVGDRLVNPN